MVYADKIIRTETYAATVEDTKHALRQSDLIMRPDITLAVSAERKTLFLSSSTCDRPGWRVKNDASGFEIRRGYPRVAHHVRGPHQEARRSQLLRSISASLAPYEGEIPGRQQSLKLLIKHLTLFRVVKRFINIKGRGFLK